MMGVWEQNRGIEEGPDCKVTQAKTQRVTRELLTEAADEASTRWHIQGTGGGHMSLSPYPVPAGWVGGNLKVHSR